MKREPKRPRLRWATPVLLPRNITSTAGVNTTTRQHDNTDILGLLVAENQRWVGCIERLREAAHEIGESVLYLNGVSARQKDPGAVLTLVMDYGWVRDFSESQLLTTAIEIFESPVELSVGSVPGELLVTNSLGREPA